MSAISERRSAISGSMGVCIASHEDRLGDCLGILNAQFAGDEFGGGASRIAARARNSSRCSTFLQATLMPFGAPSTLYPYRAVLGCSPPVARSDASRNVA